MSETQRNFARLFAVKADVEISRRELLIKIICIIGIINLVPLGIHAFVKEKVAIGSFDLFVATVLILILFLLIRKGYHTIFSYVGIAFAGMLFVYLFATGGVKSTGHLWYYTLPLFTLFLLGPQKGIIVSALFLGCAIVIFADQNRAFVSVTYPIDFQIRFISSFIVVCAFSFSFEYIREKTNQKLERKNAELQETITELQKAEQALRDNETLLRATLESTADGILVVDDHGKVICRNTRFGEMWNIPTKVLESEDDENLIHFVLSQLQSPQLFLSKVRELYTSDRHDFDALEFRDGRVFERYSEPLVVSGKMVGRVWSFRDITEREKAEKEKARLHGKLQEAEKMRAIGTLAGGVAHDLNNILSGIVSYPELILMDLPEESPLRESIKTIHDSGKKAAAIVQDLLTLARRGVSTNEVVNLNDIISEYLVSPEFEKLKTYHPLVTVDTRLDPGLFNQIGSPIHLSKTVMNLVSNAAEAMTMGGTIGITTENGHLDRPISGYDKVNEGDYTILTVEDTGIGIAAEELGRIFEPFYTKKVMGRSGTGLGMAVVWGTVKDHKGYIQVDSEPEKGTSFKLYFPATVEDKATVQQSVRPESYCGKGETVLVVDDVKEQREIASKILSQLGYTVKTASNGEEAVEWLKTETVDLVVLDMIMSPGIDGLETYEKIVAIHPDQKAIIVSGFSETKRVRKMQQMGAGAYVKKPYSLENIGFAIKSELERSQKVA